VDTDRFLTDHAHLLGNKGWHEIASHSKGVEINSSTSLQSYWLVLPLDIKHQVSRHHQVRDEISWHSKWWGHNDSSCSCCDGGRWMQTLLVLQFECN